LTQQSLITISEASHTLGVSEAALRQWTDEGKIKAFITPGGHRRYSRAELKKFMASSRKVLGIKDLVVEVEETVQLHREIARTHLNTTSWYNKLNRESQERLSDLGRRLLDLIIRYITEPSKREEITKLACNVGYNHGETLAKLGLPLTDSVKAFTMHRNPIMKATAHLMKKREGLNARVVEAIPLVDHLMDEALVSLVAAHQLYKDQSRDESKGGTGG
jgi:excisionase family DNA binding protein